VMEMFVIRDPYWQDARTWFELDGEKIEALEAEPGEAFTLTVAGVTEMGWGEALDGISGAAVVPVNTTGGFGEPLAITDANGEFTLSFDEPGTYILSVIDDDSGYGPFMAPWLEVAVGEDEPPGKEALEWWEGILLFLFIIVSFATLLFAPPFLAFVYGWYPGIVIGSILGMIALLIWR